MEDDRSCSYHIEGLAVDPNGRDVYVGATTSHVVTHMQRRCGNVAPGISRWAYDLRKRVTADSRFGK